MSKIIFDNGLQSDGPTLSFSRDIATVSPLGETVGMNVPRWGKPFTFCERPTWTTSSFPSIANGVSPIGVGSRADGSPCIIYYSAGGSPMNFGAGAIGSITSVRSVVADDWAPPGSAANTTYYARSAVIHLGMCVLLCERVVSDQSVGTTIITSQDEFQTFQIHDLPANSVAAGADANKQRGRHWAMANVFPMQGRTWHTGFWVPFSDYLSNAGTPYGGQIGLIGFTRNSSSEAWTIGGLRLIYETWDTSNTSTMHAHTAAVTTGGVVSAWGDGAARNQLLFHKLDLSDYENASVTTTVAAGGVTDNANKVAGGNQPVSFAPGKTPGSFLGSADYEYEVVQLYGAIVDDASELTQAGLIRPDRTGSGIIQRGPEALHLHFNPLNGYYSHGGGSGMHYMVSRDGENFAWCGRGGSLSKELWVYGDSLLIVAVGGGTCVHTPVPRVRTVRPLLVNPGGQNAYDGTFTQNFAPDSGITLTPVYYDSSTSTFRYTSGDAALDPQPPSDMPFDPSQAIMRLVTTNTSVTGTSLGRHYVTAGNVNNQRRNDLGFLCHLKPQAATFGWYRNPVTPNSFGGVSLDFRTPFIWHPLSACNSIASDGTTSRIRTACALPHTGPGYQREAMTLVAWVHSTQGKAFTSYPVPRSTTGADELATVSGFSVPSNSLAFRGSFQIPYDACVQLPVALPLATIYQDANNYIEIKQTTFDDVQVNVFVANSNVGTLDFAVSEICPNQIIEISLTVDGDDLFGRLMVADRDDVTDTATLSVEPTGNYTSVRFSSPDQSIVGNVAVAGIMVSGDPVELNSDWFVDAFVEEDEFGPSLVQWNQLLLSRNLPSANDTELAYDTLRRHLLQAY